MYLRRVVGVLIRNRSGQDLAEYGIALAVIAGVVAAAALALRTDITNVWANAQNAIHTAV